MREKETILWEGPLGPSPISQETNLWMVCGVSREPEGDTGCGVTRSGGSAHLSYKVWWLEWVPSLLWTLVSPAVKWGRQPTSVASWVPLSHFEAPQRCCYVMWGWGNPHDSSLCSFFFQSILCFVYKLNFYRKLCAGKCFSFFLKMYLSGAVLGLRGCMRAFSSDRKQGLLPSCGEQASHSCGFSCWGTQAPECRLSSCSAGIRCPEACGIFLQ